MLIIDSHAHVFPENVAPTVVANLGAGYNATPVAMPVLDELLRHMDASGVDKSVLCPIATKPAQVPSINRWISKLPRDRFIPLGALHPDYNDNAGEIDRLLDLDIRGVKLHPYFQGLTLASDGMNRLMEQIGDLLFVLIHGGDEMIRLDYIEPTPARLAEFHDRHPYLRLTVAHMGGYLLWKEVEKHLVGRDICFDLSYTFNQASDEQIRHIIDTHGYERILWASDFPWQGQDEALAGLKRLKLPEVQERAIAGENILRALRMDTTS